jgi:hypothetical protein
MYAPAISRPITLPSSARWLKWLLRFGLVWGPLWLIFAILSDPTPENLTYLLAIPGSGLYTLGLWATREAWLPLLARRPLRNAMLLGILNAAVIETWFLLVEKLTGAEGVAAHPNLIIDLLLTMPWYMAMVITFVLAQHRWRWGGATVLLLGAVYELGADGLVGGMFSGFLPLSLEFWLMMVLMMFWQFIPVYSSMVLPPAWLVNLAPAPPRPEKGMLKDALRPLVWLLPFTVYLLAMLVLVAALSEVLAI